MDNLRDRMGDHDIPTTEWACICFKVNCKTTTTPSPHNTESNVTTEFSWGTGHECVVKYTSVYPNAPEIEYLCICMNECYETEQEKDEAYRRLIADEWRKDQGAHLYVKAAMFILIFVLGLFGECKTWLFVI